MARKWNLALIAVFCGLCLILGAQVSLASVIQSEPTRPDWWDSADARVIFDNEDPAYPSVPSVPSSGGGTAEGTKGYPYNYMTTSFPMNEFWVDAILLHLENQFNPDKVKKFWVAYHFQGTNIDPGIEITGYYPDGSRQGTHGSAVVDGDWVYLETEMFPQPLSEDFMVWIGASEDGANAFSVDYLEMGTYCVPIPSTLLLLGGGLAGLFGLRRRLAK